jgi:hypothetical protein
MDNPIVKAKAAVNAVRVRPMSTQVAEVRQNINLIQEAMKATMKKDVHYGVIPGCAKPSLYKAGAEVIMALFKLSTDPIITNLSENGEIRYQVKVNVTTRDAHFVGSGIGECSSGEEKYMWRAAVCEEEYAATPETLRRIKFRKDKYSGAVSQVQQVRVNPSDLANTILKMAKKRALIDAVLTATGASDIFSQDIEDLPEGYVDVPAEAQKEPTPIPPSPQNEPLIEANLHERQENVEAPVVRTGDVISEPQRKRLYAIAMGAGMPKEEFKDWLSFTFNYQSSRDILRADYDKICKAAEVYK